MQWHTPIGYCIRDGRIIVHEEHRKTVQQIFTDYDGGKSTLKIAENLKARNIPNAHDRVAWTHMSIGRILENQNYLGTEIYPQIIETELFQRVQEKREQTRKNLSRGTHRPAGKERILFGGILECGECGAVYSHIQPKKTSNAVAKWKCKNYVYGNHVTCGGGFISDQEVMDVCMRAINRLIENNRLVYNTQEIKDRVSKKYRELNQRISEADYGASEDVTMLLYQRASERYKTLEVKGTKQYTAGMLEVLKEQPVRESFDEELYRKLIQKILVYKDHTVEVIFLNGCRLKMEYGNRADVQKGEANGS